MVGIAVPAAEARTSAGTSHSPALHGTGPVILTSVTVSTSAVGSVTGVGVAGLGVTGGVAAGVVTGAEPRAEDATGLWPEQPALSNPTATATAVARPRRAMVKGWFPPQAGVKPSVPLGSPRAHRGVLRATVNESC